MRERNNNNKLIPDLAPIREERSTVGHIVYLPVYVFVESISFEAPLGVDCVDSIPN